MILEDHLSVSDATVAAGMLPVSLRLEEDVLGPVSMECTQELISSVRGLIILLEELSLQWPVPGLVKR